jgi:hypothetical protein
MKRIKSLHSLGSLGVGGIETWLVNIVRLKNPEVQIDFILHASPGSSGKYEEEVKNLDFLMWCKLGWLHFSQ